LKNTNIQDKQSAASSQAAGYSLLALVQNDSSEFSYLSNVAVAAGGSGSSGSNSNSALKKKRKEIDALLYKLSQHLLNISTAAMALSLNSNQVIPMKFISEFNYSTIQSQMIATNPVLPLRKSISLIIAIELPFHILRAVNSLVVNPKLLSNMNLLKIELNSNNFLNAFDVSAAHRKMIKHFLSNLVNLAHHLLQMAGQGAPAAGGATSSAHGSTAGSLAAKTAATASSSNSRSVFTVLTYSLPDEQFDSLAIAPDQFVHLKSVL
jgi:hypothetical protein